MKIRAIALCLALMPWSSFATEELELATSEWPPFTGKTSNRHIAEDLVELALRKSGVDFEITIEPWPVALAGAQSGKYDGLVAVWYTPDRAQTLKFSKPLLENRILAVSREGSEVAADTADDLARLRVGKVAGYTYGQDLDGLPTTASIEYPDEQTALGKLLAGEVDAVLLDDLTLRYLLRDMPHEEQQRFLPHNTLARLNLHFALDKSLANAPGIMSSFNRAIDTMVADGTYNRILDLPWMVADTDNDGVHEYIAHGETMDLSAPPGDNHYFHSSKPADKGSSKRVYRVDGKQYENWDDAREAIIDEYQTNPADRMIQDNRYTIGVPL